MFQMLTKNNVRYNPVDVLDGFVVMPTGFKIFPPAPIYAITIYLAVLMIQIYTLDLITVVFVAKLQLFKL